MAIDLVQQFSVEVDSIEFLKKYLELSVSTVLDSTEEIAVKIIDYSNKYEYYPSAIYGDKNILPVLLIGGWYKSDNDKVNSFFNGYKPWRLFNDKNTINDSIDYVMEVLNNNHDNLNSKFSKDCGDGYNDFFNRYDGSTDIGYRLMSNNTFPNSLSISLTHIYYGK